MEPPEFISDGAAGDACDGPLGFRVGEELPVPRELYRLTDGGCEPYEPIEGTALYGLELVPPETFVALTLTHRTRAPGLDAYVREGEDGSYEIQAFYDPSLETRCTRSTALEPLDRCLPLAAVIQRYADAECETGAASVEDFDYSCSEPAKTLALLNRDLDATAVGLRRVLRGGRDR